MLEEATTDRRAERHEATKAEILEAAWDLCRQEGLAGLSLRDLAKRVGMRAPSLYSYFDSKHAIYDAMYAQGCEEFVAGQRQHRDTGDTLADLKARMRYFLDFCTADEVRYQLLFQRTIPGFEPSAESFAISVESLQEMADWLEANGLGGQRVLDLCTGLSVGLAAQQIANDPGGDRWVRLCDEVTEMLYAHVTRGAPASRAKRTKKK